MYACLSVGAGNADAAVTMELFPQDSRTSFTPGETFYVDLLFESSQEEDLFGSAMAVDLIDASAGSEAFFTGSVSDATPPGVDYVFPSSATGPQTTSSTLTRLEYGDVAGTPPATVAAYTAYSAGRVFLSVAPTASPGDMFTLSLDEQGGDASAFLTSTLSQVAPSSTPLELSVSAVPEPSSLLFVATALGGGVIAQRRRRRREQPKATAAVC